MKQQQCIFDGLHSIPVRGKHNPSLLRYSRVLEFQKEEERLEEEGMWLPPFRVFASISFLSPSVLIRVNRLLCRKTRRMLSGKEASRPETQRQAERCGAGENVCLSARALPDGPEHLAGLVRQTDGDEGL